VGRTGILREVRDKHWPSILFKSKKAVKGYAGTLRDTAVPKSLRRRVQSHVRADPLN